MSEVENLQSSIENSKLSFRFPLRIVIEDFRFAEKAALKFASGV
jgi:hypothetical protein